MTKNRNPKMAVKCPQCEKEFSYYDSNFRPFCSERCRMIDLGHWFSENYAIASKEPVDPDTLYQEILKKEERENES